MYIVKKDFHILFYEAQANICQEATFMELLKKKHSIIYHHFPVSKRLQSGNQNKISQNIPVVRRDPCKLFTNKLSVHFGL